MKNEMLANDVILSLCAEAGDLGTEEELLEGWWANSLDVDGERRDAAAAAAGDVAALARLRARAGLPVL